MLTDIVVFQIAFSAALFLVLWRFLSPIIQQFSAVIDERTERTTICEDEYFEMKSERRELIEELQTKRAEQRARGVKVREEIIEHMKKEAQAAHATATERAEADLAEFRRELEKLRDKLNREIDEEARVLSNVILQKVSVGSGINPDAIH
jgi:F0F1-type ATP synthase membrane subunit b/b'